MKFYFGKIHVLNNVHFCFIGIKKSEKLQFK